MSINGSSYTATGTKEIIYINKFIGGSWGRAAEIQPDGGDTHGWSCSARLFIQRTDGSMENLATHTASTSNPYATRGYYGIDVGLIELNQGDQLIAQVTGSCECPPYTIGRTNYSSFAGQGVRFN